MSLILEMSNEEALALWKVIGVHPNHIRNLLRFADPPETDAERTEVTGVVTNLGTRLLSIIQEQGSDPRYSLPFGIVAIIAQDGLSVSMAGDATIPSGEFKKIHDACLENQNGGT